MDYIYYRMYVWYKRKNDCAIVNSILFITSVKFFLCFPIMGIVIAFFESDKNNMTLMLYFSICYFNAYAFIDKVYQANQFYIRKVQTFEIQ